MNLTDVRELSTIPGQHEARHMPCQRTRARSRALADTHIKATEMALRPASNNRQIAGLVRENLLPVIQISRGYVLSVQGAPRAGF